MTNHPHPSSAPHPAAAAPACGSNAPLSQAGAHAMPAHLPKLARLQQELFDLLLGAQRNGTENMTRRELQQAWEYRNNKRIGEGNVSARVAEMLATGHLLESVNRRTCLVSGSLSVRTVFVPARQARLAA